MHESLIKHISDHATTRAQAMWQVQMRSVYTINTPSVSGYTAYLAGLRKRLIYLDEEEEKNAPKIRSVDIFRRT